LDKGPTGGATPWEGDIAGIALYITEDNPPAAVNWYQDIFTTIFERISTCRFSPFKES